MANTATKPNTVKLRSCAGVRGDACPDRTRVRVGQGVRCEPCETRFQLLRCGVLLGQQVGGLRP